MLRIADGRAVAYTDSQSTSGTHFMLNLLASERTPAAAASEKMLFAVTVLK